MIISKLFSAQILNIYLLLHNYCTTIATGTTHIYYTIIARCCYCTSTTLICVIGIVRYYYCTATAVPLHCYCYCTTTASILHCYCTDTVLLLHQYCTATVLHSYCTHMCCRTNIALLLNEYILLLLLLPEYMMYDIYCYTNIYFCYCIYICYCYCMNIFFCYYTNIC